MSNHPVVADRALRLQAEYLMELAGPRVASVVILRLGCFPSKAAVVLRQIFLLQVLVGRLVTGDLLAPHFLDQSILMGAVVALHPPLGLRRTGGDDPDAQLLTHAPKLRHCHLPPQLLAGRGFSLVHILPVGIERAWHSVVLNPAPQHAHRRPDGFFFPHAGLGRASGVIHHVHQTAPRTSPLQPVMETSVQLHQFAKMWLAFSALTMFLPRAPSTP